MGMIVFIHVLFSEHTDPFLLGIHLGVKLFGQRLCIYSALADSAKQFNKVIVPIYIPFSSLFEFHLLHHLASTWSFLFVCLFIYYFHFRLSDGYVMVSHCVFNYLHLLFTFLLVFLKMCFRTEQITMKGVNPLHLSEISPV